MPGIRFHKRYWKTINHADNEIKSIELPRTYDLHKILLRLSGTLTIGVAAATASLDRNPLGLIKKIRLVANGKDVIKSYVGASLYELLQIRKGCVPALTASGLTVAAHDFNAHLCMDIALPLGKVPLDSLLKTSKLSSLDLEITFGDAGDIVTPDATTTLALSNTKVEVSLVESFGTPADAPLILNKEYPVEKEITSTSTAFEIDNLPVGNLYRMIVLKATDAGVRENDIINEVELKAGEETFLHLKGSEIRDMNKEHYHLEAMPAGIYVLDFADYGSIGDLLDLRLVNDLKLVLDVTKGAGTTKVEVNIQEIILPAKVPAVPA